MAEAGLELLIPLTAGISSMPDSAFFPPPLEHSSLNLLEGPDPETQN